MISRSGIAFALSLGVALLVPACRSPTQITFAITTDVDCSLIDDTSFTSGPLAALTDGRPATSDAPGCASPGRVGSVVVIPSGSDDALVGVKVVMGVGMPADQCGPTSPCIVAKRALNFIPNTPLVVNIDMTTNCEGVVCNGDETCDNGQCVSAIIADPSQCEGSGCGANVLSPLDGGLSSTDSGPDATLSGGGDAGEDAAGDATIPPEASVDSAAPPLALDAGYSSPAVGPGYYGSCALLPNGTVDCWGIEAPDGVLGDNGATNGAAYYPQPVPGLSGVTSLAVGAEHACALVAGGVVECWGAQGSVGLGALPAAVPTPITSLETEDGGGPMLGVAAGDNESCALATDRETLWCWGQYDSTSGTVDVPTYVAKLGARVVELSAGYAVTCALTNDGSVWCWGQNNNGALGRSDVAPGATMLTPLQVPLGGPAEHLCVGRWHGCVVTPSHSIVCWGDDSEGQLAVAPFDDGGLAPMTIPIGQGHVLKVGCGAEHTCALFDDGGVSCWGYDYYEQLGSSVPDNGSLTPVPVPGLGPAVDLFVNDDTGCATLADGGLACWGYDAFGQLGAGPGPADGGGEPIGAYPITL